MNEKLQQAINAARNGQENEAQLLLTQVLKENPQETQAWFLLSTLVDSEQKKRAYLGKVLALDPGHPMAQKMLARLREKSEAAQERPVEEAPAPVQVEAVEPVSETLEAIQEKLEDEVVQAEKLDEIELAVDEGQAIEPDELAPDETETTAVAEAEWLGAELAAASQEMPAVELDEGEADEAVEEEAAFPDWLEEGIIETGPAPAAVEVTPATVEKSEAVATEPTVEEESAPKETDTKEADLARQRRFLNLIYYLLVTAAVIIFLIFLVQIWRLFF
jgi:hypothetical protein